MSQPGWPYPHDGPSSGLLVDARSGGVRFVMPRLQAGEPVPLMSFGVQSLQDLAGALDALAAGVAVELLRFVSSRSGPGQAVDIAPAVLVDIVAADLLGTVGTMPVGDEGASASAIDVLLAARHERTDAERRQHRRRAAELLGLACREYEAAAAGPATYRTAARRRHRFLRLFPMFGSVLTAVFYAKASLLAATIAMIHRGESPGAAAWADHASSLFARYHTWASTLVAGEIATQARSDTRSVAKLDELYHQRQIELPWQRDQFDRLHVWLTDGR